MGLIRRRNWRLLLAFVFLSLKRFSWTYRELMKMSLSTNYIHCKALCCMLLAVGRAAMEQWVVPMPEECTVVKGGTEHTLKDPPGGRRVGAPRTRRQMEKAH